MTRRRAATSLLLAAMLLAAALSSAAADARSEGEVVATLEAFAAHLNAGEWDAALELYAEDDRFYWVERGRVAYPSRAALAQAFLGLGDAVDSSRIELSEPRVAILPDGYAYASVEAWQQMSFAGGQSIEFSGVMSILLIQTPDGWRFLSGHTSMEPPANEGDTGQY